MSTNPAVNVPAPLTPLNVVESDQETLHFSDEEGWVPDDSLIVEFLSGIKRVLKRKRRDKHLNSKKRRRIVYF